MSIGPRAVERYRRARRVEPDWFGLGRVAAIVELELRARVMPSDSVFVWKMAPALRVGIRREFVPFDSPSPQVYEYSADIEFLEAFHWLATGEERRLARLFAARLALLWLRVWERNALELAARISAHFSVRGSDELEPPFVRAWGAKMGGR